MKKKEFKIGEVFQCGLVKLKCVKQEEELECNGCFFEDYCTFDLGNVFGECASREREDKTDVIFAKVEE